MMMIILPKCIFSKPNLPSTCMRRLSTIKKRITYLLVYSFIYVFSMSAWAHGLLCYSMDNNPLLFLFISVYFDAHVLLDLANFQQTGSCALLTCPDHSLNISLLSHPGKYFRLTLLVPGPSPGISHFSREPWFVLSGNGT